MKWEEPGEVRRTSPKSGEYDKIARALAAQPGRWARVIDGFNRGGGGAPQYAREQLKARGCEATTRKQGDGTSAMYARYVG